METSDGIQNIWKKIFFVFKKIITSKIFIFIVVIIFVLAISIILRLLMLHKEPSQPGPIIPIARENPNDASNNNFPFTLTSEQINDSLTKDIPIIISPVDIHRPEQINELLLKNGWKLIDTKHYMDGGSKTYDYFKTKDVPAMWINYKVGIIDVKKNELYGWIDVYETGIKSMKIGFIHPDKIGSWLLATNKIYLELYDTFGERFNNNFNVEELMECNGTISEIRPGFTECIKN